MSENDVLELQQAGFDDHQITIAAQVIKEGPLPGNALLQKYARSGAYTDCFPRSCHSFCW